MLRISKHTIHSTIKADFLIFMCGGSTDEKSLKIYKILMSVPSFTGTLISDFYSKIEQCFGKKNSCQYIKVEIVGIFVKWKNCFVWNNVAIGTPSHSALHQQRQEEEDYKQANMEVNYAELEILENQLCW